MNLGLFSMPLHRPEKPWAQALREDREQVLLADRLGFAEAWIGEHFSSKAEQIPSPMMFLATLIEQTGSIRLGTGVVNLSHHHPAVVAAEAAMFDQLSGGRLLLGVGPGGLASDAELFGHEDIAERALAAMESIDAMLALWRDEVPLHRDGERWPLHLERNVWRRLGFGYLCKPLQQPHPPIAMAMVAPQGRTVETIAERDFIPISANFVPAGDVLGQWQTYVAAREKLGRSADRSIWRVCRNVLVTGSDAEAEDLLADPDGVFAFYFRYLRSARRIEELRSLHEAAIEEIDPLVGVAEAIDDCVIAGSPDTVLDRLVALVDLIGPFGTLVTVGHDEDGKVDWAGSMRRLAEEVIPRLSRHADAAH